MHMEKALPLLVSLLMLSVSFADFIDYDATYALPDMREYGGQTADHFATEDVQYELNLDLSLPPGEEDRYLGGGGSASDLRDGSDVCEGTFNYVLDIEAWALEDGFSSYNPAYYVHDPDDVANCGSSTYPSCPGSDTRVLWDEDKYEQYSTEFVQSSKKLGSSNYGWRQVAWRESEFDSWSTNEAGQVATVMKGSYSLKRGSTTIVSGDAGGTSISRSGNFELTSSSRTEYTITERLDVTGALIGVYLVYGEENYYPYTSTYPGQPEYTKSNIHDDGELTVYAEENVGVEAPSIEFVDLYADGVFPDPEVVTPGDTIPVDIQLDIPAVGEDFLPLHFEFYEVQFTGPAGFAFTPTDFGAQCEDSRMYIGKGQRNNNVPSMPGLGETENIEGNLAIPSTLEAGEYDLSFRVRWRTCSGEVDCNGNGDGALTGTVTVTVEVEDEGGSPDLVCTLEPASYSSASAVEGGQIMPGEGVESWRVTVTNVGDGPAVVPTSTVRSCSAVLFEAMDNEGTTVPSPSPAYYAFVPNSFPYSLDPGASRTLTIPNAQVYCSEEGGGQLYAEATPNAFSTPLVYSGCSGNMIEEPQGNNMCTWEMDCAAPTGCWCQVYPEYSNGRAGEEYDFYTNCNGGDCGDAVSWALTTAASQATITSSSPEGASVLLAPTIPPRRVVRLQATMDLGCAEPTVCSSSITVAEGGGDYCTVIPSSYPDGAAGEEYDFTIQCNGGASPCPPAIYWSITEGSDVGEIVSAIPSRATVGVSEDAAAGERVRVTATTSFEPGVDVTCDGTIIVTESPKNCTCIPPSYNDGEPGGTYEFEVLCGGVPCTGGAVWDWGEPAPPRGTRFVDIGSWGAIIEVSEDADPWDEIHARARMNGGDMTCYCHIYMDDGECEIDPESLSVEPGDVHTFDLTCDGGSCWTDVEWEISAGEPYATILDSDNREAEVQFNGEGGVTLLARPEGYGICTAVITIEDNPEDDVLGCWIIITPQYGYPGSHHEFDLWCRYGDGREDECEGEWMITHGDEWVAYANFLDEPGLYYWADIDLVAALFSIGDTVDIHATVQEDEDIPPAHCDAVIELPSMDCLDFI